MKLDGCRGAQQGTKKRCSAAHAKLPNCLLPAYSPKQTQTGPGTHRSHTPGANVALQDGGSTVPRNRHAARDTCVVPHGYAPGASVALRACSSMGSPRQRRQVGRAARPAADSHRAESRP